MHTESHVSREKYKIIVIGVIDPKWKQWFDNFTIIPQENNQTMLIGSVPDQAALHGILTKIHNFGLSIFSVNHLESLTVFKDEAQH
jgi:hypothetical protein